MLDFGFYNMDCMEGMKEFPDKYFDLAIVDPPYGNAGCEWINGERFGERFDKYKMIHRGVARQGQIQHQFTDSEMRERGVCRTGGTWAKKFSKKLFRGMLRQKKNISKNFFASHAIRLYGGGNYFELPATRCFLIWRKTNVPQNFSMAMAEYAWTSFNANAKVFEFSAVGQPGRFHPTQKPIELYTWILQNYAKEGFKILDTHVGSASSLIACERLNFKYVGFEIDEEYYRLAKERIERETAQLTLFNYQQYNFEGGDNG